MNAPARSSCGRAIYHAYNKRRKVMFSFMFGVLGVIIFWGIYIILSFVIAIIAAKFVVEKKHWKEFKEGKDNQVILIPIVAWMVLWPILIILLFVKYIFTSILLVLLRKVVLAIDSAIPTIKIEREENK
jgi:ABC-type antimicrobial peptide transport system permease subunit